MYYDNLYTYNLFYEESVTLNYNYITILVKSLISHVNFWNFNTSICSGRIVCSEFTLRTVNIKN